VHTTSRLVIKFVEPWLLCMNTGSSESFITVGRSDDECSMHDSNCKILNSSALDAIIRDRNRESFTQGGNRFDMLVTHRQKSNSRSSTTLNHDA
jgi:hypothetical protein